MQALISDFDRLTLAQRALVTHWIIDDPDQLSGGCVCPAKPTFVATWTKEQMQADLVWDRENEEIGQ